MTVDGVPGVAAPAAAAGQDDPVPAGFMPLAIGGNPFIELIGPLYGHRDEGLAGRLVLALRVERRHCSPSDHCHGGMLTAMADMLLVLGANLQSGQSRFMSTVSLSTDFLAPVPLGAWLHGRLDVLRATRNLVFCQGLFSVGDEPVLRVDGIVKPIGDADPRFSAQRYFR
jgi:uncharacterized protein (TIGR00369 family)